MNNIVKMMLAVALTYVSCEQEDYKSVEQINFEEKLAKETESMFLERVKYSQQFHVTDEDIANNDKILNVANFNSPKEFFDQTEQIFSMNDEELNVWEKENKFISLRSIINEAYLELNKAETEDEINLALSNYSDVLHTVNERIVPKLDLGIYNRIANSNGVYSVGNMVYKRTPYYLFSTLKTFKKNLLNAELHEMTVENQIHTYVLKKEESVNSARAGDPNDDIDDGDPDTGGGGTGTTSCSALSYSNTYRADVSGCASDREVTINATVAHHYIPIWNTVEGHNILTEIWRPLWHREVSGERKLGWPLCSWKDYQTIFELRNYRHTVNGFERVSGYIEDDNFRTFSIVKDYTEVLSYVITPYEVPAILDFVFYGDPIKNEKILFVNNLPKFKSLHAEGSSRGVGSKWAIINCN
jgi:hypothetical protein